MLVQGNAKYKESGSRKGNTRTGEEKTYTAGYQSPTESLCLGRMGGSSGAPENVASELKTDTCTAAYQPATESLCLRCMCAGKGAPERGYRSGRTRKTKKNEDSEISYRIRKTTRLQKP